MNLKTTSAIVKFTLLEVLRTRLWLFAIGVVVTICLVAEFSASLAITESFEYRIMTFAALIRVAAVFIITLFVSSSVIREFDDAVFDLVISRPVSRTNWYLSKQLGFFVVALLLAMICAMPLIYFGGHELVASQLMMWWSSFFAELSIVTAASIACAITLRNTTMTITVVLAFYLLSRVVGALVLMSTRAAEEIAQPANLLVANSMRALSYLLPNLDRYANPDWLLAATTTISTNLSTNPSADIVYVLVQTVIYVLLLSSVGLFDLYRRNL